MTKPATRKELYRRARRVDIPGRSMMTKAELQRALARHGDEAGGPPAPAAAAPGKKARRGRRAKARHAVLLAVAAVVVAACAAGGDARPRGEEAAEAPPAPPAAEPRSLAEGEWRLVARRGAEVAAGPAVTLEIEKGRLGGYAGCNWYGAEYASRDGRLDIGQTEGTARGCADPALAEREAAYLGLLGEVAAYRSSDRELVLEDREGRPLLRYARHVPQAMDPARLVGTEWRLVSIDGEPPPHGVAPVLRFGASSLAGFAGCRDFTGTYGAEGEKIRVTRLAMTETECADPARHEAEHRFVSVLSEAARWRLGDGRLELSTDSRHSMLLAAAG